MKHFILLPSYFFLSDRRVPPGECGFTFGNGNPGTNGVITKLAAERGIKAKSAILQAVLPVTPCLDPENDPSPFGAAVDHIRDIKLSRTDGARS